MAANMGSMRILIKGGKVVNDDFTQEADVYIENGIIQQVTCISIHSFSLPFTLHPVFVFMHTHIHSQFNPHIHCPVYLQLLVWLI